MIINTIQNRTGTSDLHQLPNRFFSHVLWIHWVFLVAFLNRGEDISSESFRDFIAMEQLSLLTSLLLKGLDVSGVALVYENLVHACVHLVPVRVTTTNRLVRTAW